MSAYIGNTRVVGCIHGQNIYFAVDDVARALGRNIPGVVPRNLPGKVGKYYPQSVIDTHVAKTERIDQTKRLPTSPTTIRREKSTDVSEKMNTETITARDIKLEQNGQWSFSYVGGALMQLD